MAFEETSPGSDIYKIVEIDDTAEFLADLSGVLPLLYLFPFMGGEPDPTALHFSPWMGPGETLGPRVDLSYGFRWNIIGGDRDGWQLYAVDTQAAKAAPLANYHAPGWQFILRFPVAELPTAVGGFHEFKKLIMGGDRSQFHFFRQNDPTVIYPSHVEESFQIYHESKRNNVMYQDGRLRSDYRVGKAGSVAPPFFHVMDGATILESTRGKWLRVVEGSDEVGVKQFSQAQVSALLAANPSATHIAMDATLGYEVAGNVARGGDNARASNLGAMTEDGVLSSVHHYYNGASAGDAHYCGVNVDDASYPGALVSGSQTEKLTPPNTTTWYTFNATGGTLGDGVTLWGTIYADDPRSGVAPGGYIDTGGPAGTCVDSGVVGGPWEDAPDPFPAGGSQAAFIQSTYITYVAGSPPSPGGAGVLAGLGVGKIGGMMGG